MVHRSYLDHGTIQVAVYDNRLEITSPGKLPMGQTMERMKEGYSKIRNEALAHAFAYMNLIKHWGSGIPRIIDKVKAARLREPKFIAETPTETQAQYAEKLGISKRTISRIFAELKEQGILEQQGNRRKAKWLIIKKR